MMQTRSDSGRHHHVILHGWPDGLPVMPDADRFMVSAMTHRAGGDEITTPTSPHRPRSTPAPDGLTPSVLDALPDHIALLDRCGTVLVVNAAWDRFTGTNHGDPARCGIGVNYLAVCQSAGADEVFHGLSQVLDGSLAVFELEYPCHAPDHDRWFHLRAVPWSGGAVVTHTNATGVHRAEAAVRTHEHLFRALVHNTGDLVSIVDQEGILTYQSPALYRLLGVAPEEFIGTNGLERLHPDDLVPARRGLMDLATIPGGTTRMELRVRHTDGSWRWFDAIATNLLDDPDVGGIVINARDVTARKAVEVELERERELLRQLMDSLPDLVFFKDANSRFVRINRTAAAAMGLAHPDAAVGKLDADLVPAAVAAAFVADDQAVMASGTAIVDRLEPIVTADGTTRWLSTTKAPTFDLNGLATGVVGIGRDITARVVAETALRASEARFRTLVERLPAITYVKPFGQSEGANDAYLSPQVEAFYGYALAEWQVDPELWARLIHPEDRDGVLAEAARTDATGEPFAMEYRQVARDGRVVWVRDEAVLIRDEAGAPLNWQGVVFDITAAKAAEAALREAEAFATSLVESSADGILALDLAGRLTVWNRAMERSTGLAREAVLGRDVLDLFPFLREIGEDRLIAAALAGEEGTAPAQPNRIPGTGKDGVYQAHYAPLRNAAGRLVGALDVVRDVTAQHQLAAALRASEGDYRRLFELAGDAIVVFDPNGEVVLDANERACALYGLAREDLVGSSLLPLSADPGRAVPHLTALRASGDRVAFETVQYRADGTPATLAIHATRIEYRGRPAVLSINRDITAQKALERQLEHQAFHDSLTGLPNRALFRDRLEHALVRRTDHPTSLAVLFLDLDDFKVVNDTLGHDVGDRLLVAVADRLRHCLRDGDTLARLGGDEFTVLLEGLLDRATAEDLAERLAAALRVPVRLDDRDVIATASIGVATPSIGATADEVLRLADVALYEAKRRGKDRVASFDVGMDAHVWQRLELEDELRRAIADGQLVLYYQPVVDLADGRVTGLEALVRWEHPERGLLPPGEFVPLAEETGLVVLLGRWVLGEACRQMAVWHRDCPRDPPLGLSVNLSARQLYDPGLANDVTHALNASGLPAGCLTLEVTETAALGDAAAAATTMATLKDLGVRLAIDDFGAGYAGLGYLRRFPVDGLKVDRSFVAGLGTDPADAALVRAVVEYARAVGLEATAEGIETAAQVEAVRGLGCARGQGFFFGRPVPADQVPALLVAPPAGGRSGGRRVRHLTVVA